MSNVVTASTGRSFTSQTIKYANSSLKSTSDSTVTPYLTAGNQWAYIAVVLGILVFAALLALAVRAIIGLLFFSHTQMQIKLRTQI